MFKWNAHSVYVLFWLLTKILTGFSLAYFFLITACCCPWISRLAASHKMLQTITPCCHQTAQHILPAIPTSYSWLLYPDILQPRVVTLNKDSLLWYTCAFIFCIVAFFSFIGTGRWRKDMKHTLSSVMEVKVRPSTCSAGELWISGCKRNSTS